MMAFSSIVVRVPHRLFVPVGLSCLVLFLLLSFGSRAPQLMSSVQTNSELLLNSLAKAASENRKLSKYVRRLTVQLEDEQQPHAQRAFIYSVHLFNNYTRVLVVTKCTKEHLVTMTNMTGQHHWRMWLALDHCPFLRCGHMGYFLETNGRPSLPPSLLPITVDHSTMAKSHVLTSCISPLTLYVDWTNFIDFVEIWMQQGMTRIHVYWHSMCTEAERVITLYLAAQVAVMHEWPLLPDGLTYDVAIYGQYITNHDCLMISQAETQWVSFMDLDEMPHVRDESLLDFLGTVPADVGAIQWMNLFAYPVWDEQRKSMNPRSYDLTYLRAFDLEMSRRFGEKNLVRPEGIRSIQLHWIAEMTPGYRLLNLSDSTTHLLAHLRKSSKFQRNESAIEWFEGIIKCAGLSTVVDAAQAAWSARRQHLPNTDWPYHAYELNSRVDKCSYDFYERPRECWSVIKCNHLVNMTKYGMKLVQERQFVETMIERGAG